MGKIATLKPQVHNRFDIEIIDSKTGEVKGKAQAENIILNALWTRLLTPATYNSYIFFGVGTGELSASRTSLFSHLGYKANTSRVLSDVRDSGYFSCRHAIQLAPEEYVGKVLTEVGIGHSASSSSLVTHAMLKDMNGNPTSITKTALDVINIYSTVYVSFSPTTAINLGMDLDAAGNKVFMSPAGFDYPIRWLFGVVEPTGQYLNFLGMRGAMYAYQDTSHSNLVYRASATRTLDVANKKATFYARVPVGSANFAQGILGVELQLAAYENFSTYTSGKRLIVDLMDSSIFSGSQIAGENIGTGDGETEDFSSDYVIGSGGAVVKVDGVEQTSGVTVDTMKPVSDNIFPFMRTLYRIWPDGVSSGTAYQDPMQWLPYPNGESLTSGGNMVWENTMYQTHGISSITTSTGLRVSASTDLINWSVVGTAGSSDTAIAVAETYKYYRYWKAEVVGAGSYQAVRPAVICGDLTGNTANIHFATPPAVGAVVTVDYTTPVVAKDSNHVFDLTLELQFGEYTP